MNEKIFVQPNRILGNPIGISRQDSEILFIFVNRSVNLKLVWNEFFSIPVVLFVLTIHENFLYIFK